MTNLWVERTHIPKWSWGVSMGLCGETEEGHKKRRITYMWAEIWTGCLIVQGKPLITSEQYLIKPGRFENVIRKYMEGAKVSWFSVYKILRLVSNDFRHPVYVCLHVRCSLKLTRFILSCWHSVYKISLQVPSDYRPTLYLYMSVFSYDVNCNLELQRSLKSKLGQFGPDTQWGLPTTSIVH
jgi:hypothetical protein